MSEHAWGCSLYIGFQVAVEVAVEGDWIQRRLDSKIVSIELPVEHAKLSTLRPAIRKPTQQLYILTSLKVLCTPNSSLHDIIFNVLHLVFVLWSLLFPSRAFYFLRHSCSKKF